MDIYDPQLNKIHELIEELENKIKDLPDNIEVKETDEISKSLYPEYCDLNKAKIEKRIFKLILLFERMKKWDGQKLQEGKKYIITQIAYIEYDLNYLLKHSAQNPRNGFITSLKGKEITDQPPIYEYPYSTNEQFDKWRQLTIDYYINKFGGSPLKKYNLRKTMRPATMSENYPEDVEEVIFLTTDNTLRRMNISEFEKYVMNKNSKRIKVLIIGPSRNTGFHPYKYCLQADVCSTIEQIILYNGINIIYPFDKLEPLKVKSVIIPPTVKFIEQEAFYNWKFLESIILPEKIRIGKEAFEGTKFVVDSNGRVSKTIQNELKKE